MPFPQRSETNAPRDPGSRPATSAEVIALPERETGLVPTSPAWTASSRVLDELAAQGLLAAADAAAARTDAARQQGLPHTLVMARHAAPINHVYAAIHQLPAELQAAIAPLLRTAADLPEWSLVLNDAGGALGGRSRERGLLVLGVSEDVQAAKAAGTPIPCMVLATALATQGAAYAGLASRMVDRGYTASAILTLASEDLADVVWARWDDRNRTAAGEGGVEVRQSGMQRLFDEIGHRGYALNASDIHIVSRGGEGAVLFRIDGDVIRQPYNLTGNEAISLCRAIYDTLTEKSSVREGFSQRSMQDGSVDRPYEDCRLRFRYAGQPVEPNGYRVAMRIIPIGTHARPKTLAELGYAASHQTRINRAFNRSSGLVLFAGTTGSGKSTTLSSRLQLLCEDRPTKVVLTVEEPVEYIIPGAFQTAVTRAKGEDGQTAFQRALRSVMRLDPDVLMLGEVRDLETADMSLQGVRSGHLLLSTMHSGGAPMCYDRMAGLGVARADLATVDLVAAFVFQALVQTLCEHCRIPARDLLARKDSATVGVLARLRHALELGRVPGAATTGDGLDGIYFRDPQGCAHCNHRGITGRTVCAEVFQPSAAMLKLVAQGDSVGLIEAWRSQINPRDAADMTGRRAIEHAMWKMALGLTAPDEVERQFRELDEPIFEGLA